MVRQIRVAFGRKLKKWRSGPPSGHNGSDRTLPGRLIEREKCVQKKKQTGRSKKPKANENKHTDTYRCTADDGYALQYIIKTTEIITTERLQTNVNTNDINTADTLQFCDFHIQLNL